MTKQFYEEAIAQYNRVSEEVADAQTLTEHSRALKITITTEKGTKTIDQLSSEFKQAFIRILYEETEYQQQMSMKATIARKYDEEHNQLADAGSAQGGAA